VTARIGEMGIRVALGAGRPRLVAMVVGDSLVPVAVGLAVGLGAALALSPLGAGLLYGVGARDPLTVGGAVLLLDPWWRPPLPSSRPGARPGSIRWRRSGGE
jgi:hypothetical protein